MRLDTRGPVGNTAPTTALTCAYSGTEARHELRRGDELLGFFDGLRLATPTAEWLVSVRRHRGGWYAAAVRSGSDRLEATYHPASLPGGTLVASQQRYRLRQAFVSGRWRLRDGERQPLATFTPSRRRAEWPALPEYTVEMPGLAGAQAEMPLLLLLCLWAIENQSPGPPASGANP